MVGEDQPMESHLRFRGGGKPPKTGFATPHVAGIAGDKLGEPEEPGEPEEAVNDSFGSIHLADTMDTDPDEDSEAGGKGDRRRAAE
jgi:hypothetical protein